MFIVVVFVLRLLLPKLTDVTRQIKLVSYSSFLDLIDKKQIKHLYIDGQDVRGILKDSTVFQSVIPDKSVDWQQLRALGITFEVANQADYSYAWYFMMLVFAAIILGMVWFFFVSPVAEAWGAVVIFLPWAKVKLACLCLLRLKKPLPQLLVHKKQKRSYMMLLTI